MELPTYFSDFLSEIRPTLNQISDYKAGHRTLRRRLMEDDKISPAIVSTFLQGSYRRATAVRPIGENRPDVDVMVVTKLSKDEFLPGEVFDKFEPFLEKHYKGKFKPQGRSFAIELSYVDLDLVLTAAPTESQVGIMKSEAVLTEDTPEDVSDWKLSKSWVDSVNRSGNRLALSRMAKSEAAWQTFPLLIPDRDTQKWEETHPLEQIKWTWEKNAKCNSHYVNVVKAVKWWRKVKYPDQKYPKGYPLEHVVGYCCPDSIDSVAEGLTRTFEAIIDFFTNYYDMKTVPNLKGHGAPNQNVLHRLSIDDFRSFYEQVKAAALLARRALDEQDKNTSVQLWRDLLGDKFPPPSGGSKGDGGDSGGGGNKGYTPRTVISGVGNKRFARV